VSAWEAILLGVVQGATEFLPVSSSGHLVVGQELLGLELPGYFFEIVVHVATLVSVMVVYHRRIRWLVLGCVERDEQALRYVGLLLLASVPAAIVGIAFEATLRAAFDRPVVTGVALLVTGALLWSVRGLARGGGTARVEGREGQGVQGGRGAAGLPRSRTPGPGDAALMGVAQAFAIVPGISRSGATVVTGLWRGLDGREAAAFSFLMSIPVIAGATLLTIPEISARAPILSWPVLGTAAVAAGLVGVFAIRTFVAMLRLGSFHLFAAYCWVVGAAFLIYLVLP